MSPDTPLPQQNKASIFTWPVQSLQHQKYWWPRAEMSPSVKTEYCQRKYLQPQACNAGRSTSSHRNVSAQAEKLDKLFWVKFKGKCICLVPWRLMIELCVDSKCACKQHRFPWNIRFCYSCLVSSKNLERLKMALEMVPTPILPRIFFKKVPKQFFGALEKCPVDLYGSF